MDAQWQWQMTCRRGKKMKSSGGKGRAGGLKWKDCVPECMFPSDRWIVSECWLSTVTGGWGVSTPVRTQRASQNIHSVTGRGGVKPPLRDSAKWKGGGWTNERMLFNVTSRASNDSICYVSDSDTLGITASAARPTRAGRPSWLADWPPDRVVWSTSEDVATGWPALGDDEHPARPVSRLFAPSAPRSCFFISVDILTCHFIKATNCASLSLFILNAASTIPLAWDYYASCPG